MDWRKQKRGDIIVDVNLVPPQAGTLVDAVCVVIDVLRATSTIVTLFDRGARFIYPVGSIDAARILALQKDCSTVGEQDAVPVPGFDLYNSPSELSQARYDGQEFVISSTNGTLALVRVSNNPIVICGSLLNASACCALAFEQALAANQPIHLVCSGNFGEFALDDFVCAGYLVGSLRKTAAQAGKSLHLTETTLAAEKTAVGYPDPTEAFIQSSGMRLLQVGRPADIAYCAQIDQTRVVPVMTSRSPLTIEAWRAGPDQVIRTAVTQTDSPESLHIDQEA